MVNGIPNSIEFLLLLLRGLTLIERSHLLLPIDALDLPLDFNDFLLGDGAFPQRIGLACFSFRCLRSFFLGLDQVMYRGPPAEKDSHE
jgi:hypothetical protein